MEAKKEESSTKKDWMVSPRLSFSHDIPQTELCPSSSSSHESNVDTPMITDVDFDFTTSLEMSIQEPCSADELFSNGKILPLSLKPKPQPLTRTTTTSTSTLTRTNVKKNTTTLKEIIDDEKEDQLKKETERKPFWMFGRSGSVGSNRTTSIVTTTTSTSTSTTTKQKNNNICPFRRSRSAGCSTVKTRSKNYSSYNYKNTLRPMESSSKIYYYSGMKSWSHGDGVRINPVINLPRGGSTASCRSNGSNSSSNSNNNNISNNSNTSSIFGYLLCKCSTKGMEMEMERRGVTCSP